MVTALRIFVRSLAFVLVGWTTVGVAQAPLSALVGNDLRWEKLPESLTAKVVPLLDKDHLRLKFGKTPGGEEYLSIAPPRKAALSFGIRDPRSGENGYIVSAKKAYYWPGRGLFRFEREVIVSATVCRLEGTTFDLHLRHETTRLSGPNIVVSLTGGLLPIESDSVRIAGLDGGEKPTFQWDPRTSINDRPVLTRPAPRRYRILIREGGKIVFEGQDLDTKAFESKIRNLAAREPDSSFGLELEPSAGSEAVNTVKKTLHRSGFDIAETRVVYPELEGGTLRPEHDRAVLVESDTSAPSGKSAVLLWVQGEGRFLLNGKPYDAGGIRTLLRRLGKADPARPIIVAGALDVPRENLRNLAQDLRAFGFQFVQLGGDSGKARTR